MEHFYAGVPGFARFTDFYAEQVAAAPQEGAHFVEVGSWQGRSAAFMGVEIINSGKSIRFDCVDTWKPFGKLARADLYERFLKHTEPVIEVINPVLMASVEAAKLYADQSLDMVMIDAHHSYKSASADIAAWQPKIRQGGVLAGDDYWFPGVKRAVVETFGEDGFEVRNPTTKTHRYWLVRC